MKVKRIASFAIACIMLLGASFQPVAYAQVNSKTYTPVIITIPSKEGDLEQAFRDFAKDVSDMYFGEGYDLNKYYYRASNIKHQWDKGFFVKNKPYSTYAFDGSFEEYNKYAVLDSLIQGVQKKADRMTQISIDDYFVGFTFNAATGAWEYNHVKVLEQQIYTDQVVAAVDQTLIAAKSDILNSLVDISAALVTHGNAPDQFSEMVDAFTNVFSDALKSRAKSLHENAMATLKNELRDAVEIAFLSVNDNLDEQLLEALRSEKYALQKNGAYSVSNGETKLRYDQIVYLLDAIDAANDTSLSNNMRTAAENAASALMDNVGLEVHTALSPEEIDKIMYYDIAISCTKELTKWLISTLDCSDIPEAILQSATASTVQLVADNLKDSDITVEDRNGDGAFNEYEFILPMLEYYFTKENITSVANAFFQSLIEAGLKKDLKELELLYISTLWNWDNVCKEYINNLATAPADEFNRMLEEISQAKEAITKSEQMLDEIRRQARTLK